MQIALSFNFSNWMFSDFTTPCGV